MPAKRKSFKVVRNNAHLTVYPWTHPQTGASRWRYAWRADEQSAWRYVTAATRAAAEHSAWEKLGELDAGGLIWSALPPADRRFLEEIHRLATPADHDAIRAFLNSRRKSAEIVVSVARYLAWKENTAGEKTRHLSHVRHDLESVATTFAGRVLVDVAADDLRPWFDQRTAGLAPKTANDVRSNLVSFWAWAIWDGIYPKQTTPAEKLPRVALGLGERRVLTPTEFLSLARHVAVEWRPWIVLGAFCGLRPEEISPPQKKGMSLKSKRGIRLEEIDFQFKVIRLPAEVSKTKAPRNIPLSAAALEWLHWAGLRSGQIGAACLRNPSEQGETIRLGKLVFSGRWPQDALRHSYGSYRNAVIRNLPQVAEEMGTSDAMLRRHYHNPKTEAEGAEWFSLTPKLIRSVPIKSRLHSPEQENPKSANA